MEWVWRCPNNGQLSTPIITGYYALRMPLGAWHEEEGQENVATTIHPPESYMSISQPHLHFPQHPAFPTSPSTPLQYHQTSLLPFTSQSTQHLSSVRLHPRTPELHLHPPIVPDLPNNLLCYSLSRLPLNNSQTPPTSTLPPSPPTCPPLIASIKIYSTFHHNLNFLHSPTSPNSSTISLFPHHFLQVLSPSPPLHIHPYNLHPH